MEYYIKQKVFSWSDRFTVKDVNGRDVYMVEGEFFSWGKKLHILDMSGSEVLYIEQRIWKWLPTYTLFIENEEVATIRKELSFFRPRYTIDRHPWEVTGSFWEHDYQIVENGRTVADISKEWLTWGDTYALNIHDESNALLALGVVIVIDCVMASQQSNANNS